MISPSELFDLSDFANRDVFPEDGPVWGALDELKGYLAGFFEGTWPLARRTGLIERTLVISDGEVREDLVVRPTGKKGRLQAFDGDQVKEDVAIIQAGAYLSDDHVILGAGAVVESGALIKGPTGVGKTTTIAKLAANFRLRDGVKMGLVTVDTYRIAAVEQLRTYAEIIDLPMKVVTNSLEMRRALDELVGMDLVLIDTAGRSPRDELQIQELKRLLAEADVDEVHLVLNMTASLRSLKTTAEKFAAANTTSVIVTKLDEAACLGTLLSLSRNIDLPISYMTTGQNVPADIEPAAASRIARLVLGEEQISN